MRLCIIAGSGDLPKNILNESLGKTQYISVICIKNEADIHNFNHADNVVEIALGKVGAAIEFLTTNRISHIIFAGSVKRPPLISIRADLEGTKLLALLLKEKFLGDDNLLKSVLRYFENLGFKILSPSELLASKLLVGEALTIHKPSTMALEDIKLGKEIFKKIGKLDIGQALIISEKRTIAIEGAEGTDNMIKRSKEYVSNHSVLLKMHKQGQDERVDMPTIGPNTIEVMHTNNIKGIAVDRNVIILSMQDTIDKANSLGIYIYII